MDFFSSLVEGSSEGGGHHGSGIVDPAVSVKLTADDVRSERASRVERATCKVGTQKLADEEGKPDSYRRKKSATMLVVM